MNDSLDIRFFGVDLIDHATDEQQYTTNTVSSSVEPQRSAGGA